MAYAFYCQHKHHHLRRHFYRILSPINLLSTFQSLHRWLASWTNGQWSALYAIFFLSQIMPPKHSTGFAFYLLLLLLSCAFAFKDWIMATLTLIAIEIKMKTLMRRAVLPEVTPVSEQVRASLSPACLHTPPKLAQLSQDKLRFPYLEAPKLDWCFVAVILQYYSFSVLKVLILISCNN